MNTTQTKKSELWQRFRTARQYARKTQAQVSKDIGNVTRGAMAQWETNRDEIRTIPKGDQIVAFANSCGVPPEWLLDDSQTPEGLYSYMQAWHANRRDDQAAAPAVRSLAAGRAFWAAVQYQAIVLNPALENCFSVPVNVGGATMAAPFLDGKNIASFTSEVRDWRTPLTQEVATLLLLEKALGYRCHKALFVWGPAGLLPMAEVAVFSQRLGTPIVTCTDVGATAQMLAEGVMS
jgi:transcriptional regulator with XRE-family HTH domain